MEKIEEQALLKFKDTENTYREWLHGIHVGNGILEQIKDVSEHPPLTVEFLYETFEEGYWPLLDLLLEDREDLQDRIKAYKKRVSEN